MNIISKNMVCNTSFANKSIYIYIYMPRVREPLNIHHSFVVIESGKIIVLRRPSLHADSLMRFVLFCLVKAPFFNASALACSFKYATN